MFAIRLASHHWLNGLGTFVLAWIPVIQARNSLTSKGITIIRRDSLLGEYDTLYNEIIPQHVSFMSLSDNEKSCEDIRLEGWSLHHFKQGYRPEPTAVKILLQQISFQLVASICPQALLMFLWFQMESDTRMLGISPLGLDVNPIHLLGLSIQVLKRWLKDVVYPIHDWSAISLGLPFEEMETRCFQEFLRVQAIGYSEHVEEETELDRHLGSWDARVLSLQEVRSVCPGMVLIGVSEFFEDNMSKLVVEGPIPVNMVPIGNQLSNYWQARGLAWLAGARYVASYGHSTSKTFVKYLPRKVREPSAGANYAALQAACAQCAKQSHWRTPHDSAGPWIHVLHHARSNIRFALRQSGVEERARALLRPHDVVVHFRCYPCFDRMAGFSLYDALPKDWREVANLRFLIVAGPLVPECSDAVQALILYLQDKYRQSSIVRRFTSTNETGRHTEDLVWAAGGEPIIEEDFALLVFAPVLVRTPGTFSLWGAVARNVDDLVISAVDKAFMAEIDFGTMWHWVQVPILSKEVAKKQRFKFNQTKAWINWLQSH